MIFLWNKERILTEGLELASLKISQELGHDKNVVKAQYRLNEGKLVPDFQIDKNDIPFSMMDQIDTILKDIWTGIEKSIKEKLDNIHG